MVKALVLGAELGRRAVHGIANIPGTETAIARGIIASGRLVPSSIEAGAGERSALKSFHEKAATALFDANRRGARKLLDKTDLVSAKDPDWLERMAERYIKFGAYEAALTMRQRAVELDSENPLRWVALSQSLRRGAGESVIHDTVAGLATGPGSDVAAASDALEKAESLDPGNAFVLHERGRLELIHGDWKQGVDWMERALQIQPKFRWWFDLGAAYRKPHINDQDRSLDAYEQALTLNPRHVASYRGVIIMGCRGPQDWPRLWQNAVRFESARRRRRRARLALMDELAVLFSQAPEPADVDRSIETLEAAHARGLRLSWNTTALIGYRLQFLGRLREGFTLRRGLAERTLAWLGTASADNSRHRQKVLAALIYLGRFDDAQQLIDPLPWIPGTQVERHRLEKMAADLHLVRGKLDSLVQYGKDRAAELPLPGEERMRNLVSGKRVAIVGPADTGDRLGAEIDDYDIVVRPRFMEEIDPESAQRLGSRTDIAYFNGRDFAEAQQMLGNAAESGALKLVVGRALTSQALESELPEWLRFYRHDYSLGYHGQLLGIGRIAYDVLQFEPAEVSVFNMDFYTGQRAFGSGYRDAKDQGLGPYSIVNEILLVHDLVSEHRMAKAMAATGTFNAKGVAGEVLALDEDEYLNKLETSPALQYRVGSVEAT